MGLNIDEFLEKTEPVSDSPVPQAATTTGAPTTQATPEGAISNWYYGQNEADQLDRSLKFGSTKDPETAARVLKLQDQTGLSRDFLERNLDAVETEQKRKVLDPNVYQKTAPITSQWLSEDPNHVAVAEGDYSNLNYLERQMKYISSQFQTGRLQNELSEIGESAFLGTVTPEQRVRQQEIENEIAKSGDYGVSGFAEQIPGQVANALPMFGKTFVGKAKAAAVGALTFGAAGAVEGTLGGPAAEVTVPAAALAQGTLGAHLGWRYGSAVAMARMQTGLTYLEFEKMKDENGNALDPTTVRGAAAIVGVGQGLLEFIPFEKALEKVPGLNGITAKGVQKLLSNPTTRQAFLGYAKHVGEITAISGTSNFLQEYLKDAGAEVLKMQASDQPLSTGAVLDRLFNQEILSKATAAGKQGLQVGVGLGGATGAPSLRTDLRAVGEAQATKQVFTNLGEGIKNSKLFEKMPEKTQELVSRLTKDTPSENVYIPVDSWTTYWQGKGVDPADIAKEVLGSSKEYDEAQRTGQDIQIPTAKYATTIAPTEHNAHFVDEIKTSPESMNAREAREFTQKLDAEDLAAQTKGPSPEDLSASKVNEDVVNQLKTSGMKDSTAEQYGKLYESAFKTLGKRSGEDPHALYEQYGLKISRPELAQLASEDTTVLNQEAQANGPAFYSKLQKTVEEKMGKSATVEQVRALARDLKPEEVQYSGLENFLEGKSKVSKEELLKHLEENQVQIKEVVKGSSPDLNAQELARYEELSQKVQNEGLTPKESDEYDAFEKRFESVGDAVDGTKFSKYTLPGGENYKEVLLTLPPEVGTQESFNEWALKKYGDKIMDLSDEKANSLRQEYRDAKKSEYESVYKSSHFDEPNILAHMRLNDRIDSEGKKVLFIEEVQSDWHQEGRKKGYKGDPAEKENLQKQISEFRNSGQLKKFGEFLRENSTDRLRELQAEHGDLVEAAFKEGKIDSVAELEKQQTEANQMELRLKSLQSGGIPDAPFKKTWQDLALKRIIREAAEKGYDKVAWTTGEQQAERYDLSKHVETIQYNRKEKTLFAEDKNGHVVIDENNVDESKLADFIGKEAAQKILEPGNVISKKMQLHELSGADLKVGGEGMKGFYDKILVDAANKLTKKFGGKVEESKIPTVDPENDILDSHTVSKKDGEWIVRNDRTLEIVEHFENKDDAVERADFLDSRPGNENVQTIKVHSLELTPALKESVLKEGFSLFQGPQDGQTPRGQIQIGANRQMNINLLKGADLSTFLHESGHFYLEVLGDLATKEGANGLLKSDWDTVLKWLNVESRKDIGVEQHEQFARGFEAYLMEGKAPSPELRTAFSRFRAWMVSIYRQLKNLNVNLNDDVRKVFDRMLASEEEINAVENEKSMQPLFSDPKAFGMNEAEASRYTKAIQDARASAEEHLSQKLIHQVQREQKSFYKEERSKIKDQVSDQVNGDPIYVALSVLQKGLLPNGDPLPEGIEPVKLSKEALIQDYDKNFLTRLPKPFIYAAKGGMHHDLVAQMFGFHSGDEMLMQMINAEKRDVKINRLTDAEMTRKFGDMMVDGTLHDHAIQAVHNEQRSELLRKELQYLTSENIAAFKGLVKKISRPIPTIESVRSQAEFTVAGKKVRDLSPVVYERAATRAAKESIDLLLKGDVEGAFEAKQRELLNNELYRAAANAKDRVESTISYLSKFSDRDTRAKIGKAGEEYLNQIDGLLERFDFKKSVSLKEIERRKSLLKWVQEQHEQGLTVDVPERLLNEAYRQSYKDVTYQELQGVTDTIKNIEHIAGLKNKLLKNKEHADLESLKNDVVASIAAFHDVSAKPHFEYSKDMRGRMIEGAKGYAAEHSRLEFFFEHLDGQKAQGVSWKNFFKPFADAENAETALMRESTKKMNEIFSAYKRSERATWFYKKTWLPEVAKNMTKAEMLAVALNWGNPYNRETLMRGEKWSHSQVESILNRLDARDIKTVNEIWKHIDSFWPQVEALEKRLNGIAPEKVKGDSVEVKGGTLEGGYYPILFDPKRNYQQSRLEEIQSIKDIFGGSYAKAMTKQNHLKERTDSGGKAVKLELTGMVEHISNVIHDLTHREAVIDAYKLINHPEVREAISNASGTEMYKQLNPWLKAIAGEKRTESMNGLERVMGRVRGAVTKAILGLKVTSALVQTLGYFNTVNEVGTRYAMLGLRDAFQNPFKIKQTYEFISSRSDMMKFRLENYDRDVRDTTKKLNVAGIDGGALSVVGAYTHEVEGAYFAFTGMMDLMTSVPTWLAGYKKAMDGGLENVSKGDEKGAVDYADSLVRKTQSAGGAKDNAAIQRGGETFKLFTMFYSQLSLQFNLFQQTHRQFRLERNIPKLMGSLALLWFVPAVMEEVIRGKAPSEDDDEEKWTNWLLRKEALYPFQTIVGVRDLANGLENQLDSGRSNFSGSPALQAINSSYGTLKAVSKLVNPDEELDRKDYKNIVQSIGYAGGLPTRQLWQTSEYFYDWMSGEETPDNIGEGALRTFVWGKKKD